MASKKIAKYGFFIKFLIIFVLSLVLLLKFGIKVENLEFDELRIEQLYIKLDKKLILRAKELKFPQLKVQKEEKTSGNYLIDVTQSAKWLDMLFQEISLHSLKIGDNELKILFENNSFFVGNKHFGLDVKMQEREEAGVDNFNISNLAFKDFNVTLSGFGSADIKKQKYAFSGSFNSFEINGRIDFTLVDGILRYKAYDIKANSLRDFMNDLDLKFNLNEDVKNWIYGFIIAQDYNIKELNGKVDLENSEFYLDDLNATAVAKGLKVKFEKSLEAVDVKEASIKLKNSNLYFDLLEPVYKGRKLDGSNLVIYNIFDEKEAGILLNLKTRSMYDSVINDILKAYDIKIPINQTSGKMDATLLLDINFDTINVIANGDFNATNAGIDIAGAKFNAKNADIKLINTDILKIDAKNFGLEFFNSDARANIDINKSVGDIRANLKNLDLGSDDAKILSLKDEKIQAKLDFSGDDTKLNILNFDLNLSFGDENKIQTNNASLIKHSPLLNQIGISDFRDFTLTTKDFNTLNIDANDLKFNLPFYHKDGTKYEVDDFNIDVNIQKLTSKGRSKSGLIKFNTKQSDVNITTQNLNLQIDTNETNDQERLYALNLYAKNADVTIKDLNRTLTFDNLEFYEKADEMIIRGFPSNGRFGFVKNNQKIDLDATGISGEFVNQFFGFNSFESGNFRLKILGESKDLFKGEARFHSAYIKDYIFYQQLLSFINSVPALLSFKTPDFNDKGFTVKSGKILFEKDGSLIKFIAIDIEGSSADIAGKGTIDLESKVINIDLELKILKDASNIIDKIPVVNQIILGKERSFSTLITIRGTTQKPEYSTQILQDTLLSPFNIIKNIIEAPFLIFD
ncbi:YhdP family protein [Campylobacter sp. 7477a]|uniref:YhdP family protein n=1 Tax=Campylobacter sp. 7477a TaxID=2735741 RepID=UPI003015662E|nr:AsmA-like C-terminal domain-containing protein [Campylobacter sp. 7477a]